jgi:hypothetical protein
MTTRDEGQTCCGCLLALAIAALAGIVWFIRFGVDKL